MAKKLSAEKEAAAINAGVDANDPSLNETVQEAKHEVNVEIATGEEGPLLKEAEAEAKAGRPSLKAAVDRVRAKVLDTHTAMEELSAMMADMDLDDDLDEDEDDLVRG